MGRSIATPATTTYPQVHISGNTPALGVTASYTTGLTKGSIISFTIQISDSNGTWILPDSGVSGTDTNNYQAYIADDGLLYIYIPSASTDVYGCAFSALITYET